MLLTGVCTCGGWPLKIWAGAGACAEINRAVFCGDGGSAAELLPVELCKHVCDLQPADALWSWFVIRTSQLLTADVGKRHSQLRESVLYSTMPCTGRLSAGHYGYSGVVKAHFYAPAPR